MPNKASSDGRYDVGYADDWRPPMAAVLDELLGARDVGQANPLAPRLDATNVG